MDSNRAITEEVLDAALAGDWTPLRSVPKTDLHAHLLLSAPFNTYRRISAERLIPPPQRFASLDNFLDHLRSYYFPLFTTVDVYKQILRNCFEHMVEDGIIYTEISFDTAMPLLLGISWKELVAELQPEVATYQNRIRIHPELGLARDFKHPAADVLVKEALETEFFAGIDLYGSEHCRPIDDFSFYFEMARHYKLKIKIHSGETGPAPRVREEFRCVKPDAIQHGVRASEDTALLRELAASGIAVNVCPYSNWCLSVVQHYEQHPIRKMFDAGVRVTINSDDLAIFGRSVSAEYAELYRAGVFSARELEQIRRHGLAAAPNLAATERNVVKR